MRYYAAARQLLYSKILATIIACHIVLIGRNAPVIILNEATQCYFNAGLQCLFATKSFIPWITSLSEDCTEQDKKNAELIQALSELSTTYETTVFTKWPTNKELFDILKVVGRLKDSEQYDVLTMMNMILDRLPTAKNCNNPFIIQGNIQDTSKQALNNVSIYELSIGLTLEAGFPLPTIVTAFNDNFPTLNITHYPTILCLGISINAPAASIPTSISLTKNKLTKENPSGHQYRLVGIAWRVGDTAASGHYFATVIYENRWYIVDDIIRYEGPLQPNGMRQEYSIDKPIPIEGLLVPDAKNNNYTWMYEARTTKELREWLQEGNFEYKDPLNGTIVPINPVFIVYELKDKQTYTTTQSKQPQKNLPQSLTQLNAGLGALANKIKS